MIAAFSVCGPRVCKFSDPNGINYFGCTSIHSFSACNISGEMLSALFLWLSRIRWWSCPLTQTCDAVETAQTCQWRPSSVPWVFPAICKLSVGSQSYRNANCLCSVDVSSFSHALTRKLLTDFLTLANSSRFRIYSYTKLQFGASRYETPKKIRYKFKQIN